MKKSLLLSFVLLCFISKAQEVELKWAEKIKTKQYVSILGGKQELYFTKHRNNEDAMVCRIYDKNLKLIKEKIVDFNLEEKKYLYKGSYFLGANIIHLIQDHNRKEDKFSLYGITTDFNLNTNKQVLILDEGSDKDDDFGSTAISPDSTKIVVYHQLKGKKNEPSRLSMKVYDSNLSKKLLDKVVEVPVKGKKFSFHSVTVDNFGNVFILAQILKEKSERENKKESYYYYKGISYGVNNVIKEFEFDYPDRDIESIKVIPGENNTLICTGFLKILNSGFFGKGLKAKISDEIFTVIIDCNTLTLKSSNKLELEGLYPEKPKKASDYVPYEVKNIFYKNDGGYVIVAEQYKLDIFVMTTQNGGTSTQYKFYYCDIACINVDKNNQVTSVSKMPKYQLNADNPSIIATYYNGKTYIVYEDLEKNAEAENDKETKRSSGKSRSKNALFLMTVADSGEMQKQVIYSYKDAKIIPRILTSHVMDKNHIMLNADDQLGVLSIK